MSRWRHHHCSSGINLHNQLTSLKTNVNREEVVILTAHIRDAVFADEYSLMPQVHEPASEIIKAELGESASPTQHQGQGGLHSRRRENESSLGQNHIRLIHFPLTQLVVTVR